MKITSNNPLPTPSFLWTLGKELTMTNRREFLLATAAIAGGVDGGES